MLDPGQDAPARDAIAQEARGQIETEGTLKHQNDWGLRKLAYEIGQRNEADYRWFRFEAPAELLERLDHSLKIADGVLRFRIFKVDADTPVMVPPTAAAAGPGASSEPAGAGPDETEEGVAAPEEAAAAPEEGPTAAPPPESAQLPATEPPAAEADEEAPVEPGE